MATSAGQATYFIHNPPAVDRFGRVPRSIGYRIARPAFRFGAGLTRAIRFPSLGPEADRRRNAVGCGWPCRYRGLLFSVRGLPDDILLVEKAANRGVGHGHLRVGKSAVLAARDCDEFVADFR